MNTPTLDSMLKRSEAAKWLGMSEYTLREKALGPEAYIPVFREGQGFERYHPRTIIATLARRAGVPMDVIAASFGKEAI